MSVITSLNKRAANLAQKALRLGGDFVHPVSDDSGNTPDYNDPNNIISPDGHIDLPHTVEWGEGFPSTTFLDPETGLLTTKTEGQPPLDKFTGFSPYGMTGQVLVFAREGVLPSTVRDMAARAIAGSGTKYLVEDGGSSDNL